jgi:glycosyltransferase involved in cell wall biosynthesis
VGFAIVVPCYNEAGRWSVDYWCEVLAVPGVSWLFVDDGSTDGTADLLDEVSRADNAEALRLTPNGGKADAVRRGIQALLARDPQPDGIGYMDADGAFNAADIRDIVQAFGQRTKSDPPVDAVWSSRVALAGRDIRRSTSRHYIGRVIATFVSVGQDEIPYDTQSGLKLFVASVNLENCLREPFRTRWLFELELLSRWQGETGSEMRIWEEPLNYWHDVPGSKIRGKETLRVIRELAIVKTEQRKARSQQRDGHHGGPK